MKYLMDFKSAEKIHDLEIPESEMDSITFLSKTK